MGAWVALHLAGVTSLSTGSFYFVALLGGAAALLGFSDVERALWPRPRARCDLGLVVLATIGALLPVLALRLAVGTSPGSDFGGQLLLGSLHLGLLALVAQRLPLGTVGRCLAFLMSATVVPALLPVLRPLLDAAPSFQAGHFPGWSEAIAPILTLTVIALALPSSIRLAPAGEPTA